MTVTLVTGATGTLGQALLERLDGTVRAYSRDELKQSELQERFPDVRWFLGDVRDRDRLWRALKGVDRVVHAAALKQVPACERNPSEAVGTNVVGTLNVIEACLDRDVGRALLVSSDKAVHPVNLYGASKLVAEKLWLAGNAYGGETTRFSVVRYGNVRGSRGSVHSKGRVQLTDARATRFWITPQAAAEVCLYALLNMRGGEVFVPKMPASLVADTIDHDGTETGLRPGEKLHEQLISDEEVSRTLDFGDHYRIVPAGAHIWAIDPSEHPAAVPAGFSYTSAG